MSKHLILNEFKKDIELADTTLPRDNVLTNRDEVELIYLGMYPEYREDFLGIIKERKEKDKKEQSTNKWF